MRPVPVPALVLAVHPAHRGFGWIVFDGPALPVDRGVTHFAKRSADSYAKRLRALIERHRPEVLVLEAPTDKVRPPSAATVELAQVSLDLAEAYHLEFHQFSRTAVDVALSLKTPATREQVAEAVAASVGALRHQLPPKRKPWEAANRQLAVFTAAGLALTYYAADGGEAEQA